MLSSVIQQAGQGPGVPGVPELVAKVDLAAQSANIAATTLYTVPVGGAGLYRISGIVSVTQAATTSSTMPSLNVSGWTDRDSGVVQGVNSFTGTSTNNAVGTISLGFASPAAQSAIISAADGSTIKYSTSSYASSGATPMLYAIRVKLEYLGA